MIKHIAAITFIYLCVCASWFILGGTVNSRTGQQQNQIGQQVESLWGSEQRQEAPAIFATSTGEGAVRKQVPPESSDINVNLKLEQRRKGLLWYPTYKVAFAGTYELANKSDALQHMQLNFTLPDKKGVYDNLKFSIGQNPITDLKTQEGIVTANFDLPAHQSQKMSLSYDSMGVNSWRYTGGNGLTLAKNFKLDMETNFDAIDFPEGTRSPTAPKQKIRGGWKLDWFYDNTMAGNDIGMTMPRLLNPGPLVSDVTFFAPVSLFFFFYVTWLTSTIRSIKLHPMHYFFIGAAFFSFHLLLAYSVDHIPVEWSFFVCSIVSVFLVISYISRVIPDKKFIQQVAVAQFVYLVLFSYTFFLEQFTGLIITCMSIMTLFLSMQYTVRIDWTKLLSGKGLSSEEADLKLIEEAYDRALQQVKTENSKAVNFPPEGPQQGI